jgi:CubicO group peptidase (beta-lactamase class C family)
LRDWSRPIGIDDFSGNENDVLHGPLVNQPGTKFQYGVGVDWAGTLVERITGLCLEDYFRTHIFGPLGIENITFFPNETMKSRMAYMHQRAKDGTLSVRDHLYRYPLVLNRHESHPFFMGGAGCFGKPIEYCSKYMDRAAQFYVILSMLNFIQGILATMLNRGLSPNTGARILNAETVDGL